MKLCDSSALFLLEAIRNERNLDINLTREVERDGERLWLVWATDQNGQMWRSRHTSLMLAVSTLERMISTSESDQSSRFADDLLR